MLQLSIWRKGEIRISCRINEHVSIRMGVVVSCASRNKIRCVRFALVSADTRVYLDFGVYNSPRERVLLLMGRGLMGFLGGF